MWFAKPRFQRTLTCLGLTRVELVTSRLSGVRSNQLSYRPNKKKGKRSVRRARGRVVRIFRPLTVDGNASAAFLSYKFLRFHKPFS